MVYHHQLRMCFKQLGPLGERSLNYLSTGHKIIIQLEFNFSDFDEIMKDKVISHFDNIENLFIALEVKFHGCLYKSRFILSDESEKTFFSYYIFKC